MRVLTILIVFSSFLAVSQNYVDLVKLEYTTTPQNYFVVGNESTNLHKINGNLTLPIKLKSGHSILTGMVFDQFTTSLVPLSEQEIFSAYTFKLGANIKHSKKWSTTALLLPKLASNFIEPITGKDFQLGILALAKNQKSEHFNHKFGAYFNTDRFGPFLVPLFGGYYQKNKWEIDAIIPSYTIINYSLISNLQIGANWRATVRSYNRQGPVIAIYDAPFYVHHLSNEMAGHLQYEPIKGIIVRGMAGFSLGRSFRVYEDDDVIDFGLSLFRFGDDRIPLNVDFENGVFYRAEVAYRYYLM